MTFPSLFAFAETKDFYDISLAQIITWALVAAGFILSHYGTVILLKEKMDTFDKWKTSHDRESEQRDTLIKKLEVTAERLTTLAEGSERRLGNLETFHGVERRRR